MSRKLVYTIGHSNREFSEFTELLASYDVSVVVDVRRFPTSRKFPQFKLEFLKTNLPKHGIGYVWLGDKLGGFRAGGYLNYMKSREFSEGMKELLKIVELVKKGYVAVMCMEKLWFRCHRRFIADTLVNLGYEVMHIIDAGRVAKHKLRVVNEK